MFNQPIRPVGIVGYGAYVPRYRLPGSEISRVWTEGNSKSPVREKAVPGLDEDSLQVCVRLRRVRTISAAAGDHFQQTALRRTGFCQGQGLSLIHI